MKIGVDIMGGDHAPEATTMGVIQAIGKIPEHARLVLIGNEQKILEIFKREGVDRAKVDIVPSKDDIKTDDNPTKALTLKPESSISKGFSMLSSGKLDAFLSVGNTGAMMVGSLFSVKAIEGVIRPAILSVLPKENGGYGVILDVGSNADCKPDVLYQYGLLGSILAQHVFHVENPKVGLLNIGEEEKKGNLLTQAAYTLMKESKDFNFVGNVEGRDLYNDRADVIVCDGFTGNVVLKQSESFYELLKTRGISDEFFDRFNYEQFGGTPILGINSTVMIGHGDSNANTMKNMIVFTEEVVEADIPNKIRQAFQ